jgi:alpha-galactosidase/6-phospho-beta-glucosidase family protein
MPPARYRHDGAIPVRYLRLYYERDQVVAEQRAGDGSRGRTLSHWFSAVDRLLTNFDPSRTGDIAKKISERSIHWYHTGLVPALAGLTSSMPSELVLNLESTEEPVTMKTGAVIETNCLVSLDGVERSPIAKPPEGPMNLLRTLFRYESLCREIPPQYTTDDISEAVLAHPFVDSNAMAEKIAARIRQIVEEDIAYES